FTVVFSTCFLVHHFFLNLISTIVFLFFLSCLFFSSLFFFFNDPATTEIYTLSLHDALPISRCTSPPRSSSTTTNRACGRTSSSGDRKSTRLNSSHVSISYAVFCLKKKKKKKKKIKIQKKPYIQHKD